MKLLYEFVRSIGLTIYCLVALVAAVLLFYWVSGLGYPDLVNWAAAIVFLIACGLAYAYFPFGKNGE